MPYSEAEQAARAALRDRQGEGARYDARLAPHDDLLLARRGTAFFARKLMELSDTDLYCPSAVENHSRAHVVTSISFGARRQALMLEAVHKGDRGTVSTDQEQHVSDLDLGATLPPHAIRHLFRHSAVHLNVCWRDLSDAEWDVPLAQAHTPGLTPKQLPRLRATQIWRAALSLGNGASECDMPIGL